MRAELTMLPQRDIPELLDDDLGTPEEIKNSRADLRLVNRWFGGISTSESLLRRVVEKSSRSALSVLEVGGAGGDTQRELQRRFQRRKVDIQFSIVDRSATHLNGHFPGVAGDALELPFLDESFDVVSSALLLHHLKPEEITRFLREALRVCRTAVIVNDLRRARTHLGLVYAGMPLFRSRITRHDSVASVYRAYTRDEVGRIIRHGFKQKAEISSHYLFRMGVVLWK